VLGENILATFGLNLPTGKTELGQEQQDALRVLASPALRFQTPGLGAGAGGTAGLVATRQVGAWAWGLGLSYEARGSYSPLAAAQGLSSELNPGSAIRASIGTDGLLGQNAMSFSVASTIYTKDRLEVDGASASQTDIQLGPQFSAEWEMRFGAPVFTTLTLFAFDRYRSGFKRNGVKEEDSGGNELEFGLYGALPIGRGKMALTTALDGRWHTGIGSDETISTPAALGIGGTVGLALNIGKYSLRPFVRGQFAKLDVTGNNLNGSGFSGGITLGSSLP
jgi:hypothetical protein